MFESREATSVESRNKNVECMQMSIPFSSVNNVFSYKKEGKRKTKNGDNVIGLNLA